jgi:hypothetical protein
MVAVKCYLLNEIDVMQRPVLELSPTSRKYQMLPGDIDPVLMALEFHQLSMGDIAVPYLQQQNPKWVNKPCLQQITTDLMHQTQRISSATN